MSTFLPSSCHSSVPFLRCIENPVGPFCWFSTRVQLPSRVTLFPLSSCVSSTDQAVRLVLWGNWWNTLGEEISLTTGPSTFSWIFSSSALCLPMQCDATWLSRTAAKLQRLQKQVMWHVSSARESRCAQSTWWSDAFVQHNLQNRAAETPPGERGSWQWRWRSWSLSESSKVVVWDPGSAFALPRTSHWVTAAFLPDALREIVQEDGSALRIRTSCSGAVVSLAVRKPDLSSGLTGGTVGWAEG